MSSSKTLVAAAVLGVAALSGVLATPTTAFASPDVAVMAVTAGTSGRPVPVCVPVVATEVGQDLGGGRTTARISVDGVVVGTTDARRDQHVGPGDRRLLLVVVRSDRHRRLPGTTGSLTFAGRENLPP